MTSASSISRRLPPWRDMLAPLPLGIPWSSVGFALRTTAASLTALYIALALDFGEAKWAAMTVWIVAQPSRGMSLSKSRYRLAGTLTGACVAVALVNAFAQLPEMFFLALATWLALCTALSTALRNFRSYGAVLAGYTAAIIGIAGASQPAALFDLAVARVAYISLGIVVEASFAAIFAPGSPVQAIHQGLETFLRSAATITARALRGENTSAALQSLFASTVELGTAGEYAAAGSPEARRSVGHLRAGIADALSQLVAAQAFREHHPDLGKPDLRLVAEAADVFASIAARPSEGANALEDFREGLRQRNGTIHDPTLAERLAYLFSKADEARRHARLIGDRNAPASHTKFAFHSDLAAATLNGVRAFFALLAAAAFWVESAWSSGGSLVVIVAIVTSLFSTRPNAVVAGTGFIKGAAAAIAAAGICNFLLLPGVSGFPALAAITAPFLVAGGIAMRLPKFAAPAASFTLFFWDNMGPDNAARPDFAGFANSGLTLLIGIACGTLMFALVFPYRPLAVGKRLFSAAQRDLRTIGTDPGCWSQEEWLSRTADRMSLLAATNFAASAETRERAFRGMLAVLTIGHAAIALSELNWPDDPATAKPIRAVLRRVSGDSPERLATQALRAARLLSRLGTDATIPASRRHRLAQGVIHCEDIARAATSQADLPGASGDRS